MSSLSRCWVLILAAGASTRFGSPKALAPWQDGTLLSHAISVATAVTEERVMVVLGAHAERIRDEVQTIPSITNFHWRKGMGHSLATGILAILDRDESAEAVMILPVDQPLVPSRHLVRLAQTSLQTDRIALTSDGLGDGAIKGPPACLPGCYFPQALSLEGQAGLKSILTETNHTTVDHAQALLDADTLEALQQLQSSAFLTHFH